MTEMIERVANVLLLVAREKGKQKGYDMLPISEADLEFFETQARAAIEAMREPTPEMKNAGSQQFIVADHAGEHIHPDSAADIWRAMMPRFQAREEQ